MNTARLLAELAHPGSTLTEFDAARLASALLDNGLPELEHGAAVALLEVRPLTVEMVAGFHAALAERCFRIAAPAGQGRVVAVAAWSRPGRGTINLLPLLAIMLQKLGMSVLVHGSLDGAGAAGTAHVLRELAILPCASLAQASARLEAEALAFVPTAVLAPGLATLTAQRARLGCSRLAHLLARLLDPCAPGALRVIAAGAGEDALVLRSYVRSAEGHALLLEGTEGEPFAHPACRPALELFTDGIGELLFPAAGNAAPPRTVPAALDAAATADWTRRALRGEVPLPLPLVNQLACCLYGAGHATDINQAKAIVALETGSLAAA